MWPNLRPFLQLPPESDEPIDVLEATNAIAAAKDVDGLTDENAGKLSRGLVEGTIIPCTPMGCMHLIKKTGVKIQVLTLCFSIENGYFAGLVKVYGSSLL